MEGSINPYKVLNLRVKNDITEIYYGSDVFITFLNCLLLHSKPIKTKKQ